MTLPKQILSPGVMDEGERMSVQTQEGERTEVKTIEKRWKRRRAELLCQTAEKKKGSEAGTWQEGFQGYHCLLSNMLSPCDEPCGGDEGRSLPSLCSPSPRYVSFLSPPCISLFVCPCLPLSCPVFVAGAEHSLAAGHLALVWYSKWLYWSARLPAWLAG